MRVLVVALLGCALALGASGAVVEAADARSHHVVVVGDSIMLGAKDRLASKYSELGWTATLDMEVNRSTTAGLRAIEAHRAELGDTLVIGLGANDAGDTDAFREKVQRVLVAVADVAHVYWLTIAEARPYYRAANQVLRDSAALHPNLSVIDWAAYAAASPTVAGSDGLHLTPSGAADMANLVAFVTLAATLPAPPPPKTTTALTTIPDADDQPAPTASTASTVPTTSTTLSETRDGKAVDTGGQAPRSGRRAEAEASHTESRVENGSSPVIMIVLVGLAVAIAGTWLVVKSRRRGRKT